MRDGNRDQAVEAADGLSPSPIEVLCGPVLCQLHVWSEFEWTALPESERPICSEHILGLGWVGAIPVHCLN